MNTKHHSFLRIFKVFLAVICFLVYLVVKQWPDQESHLIFCDVGQGDAILITRGFWQMLIDGGPNDSVSTCLNEFIPFWDKNLEMVVATHADSDHISGLSLVLKQYNVDFLMLSDAKNSNEFAEFWNLVLKQVSNGMQVKEPILGQVIRLNSELKMQVIAPNDHFFEQNLDDFLSNSETILSDYLSAKDEENINHNNRSIVLFLEIEKASVLLMGDLEKEGEQALIDWGLIKDIDLLKVGHHGSKTSSLSNFLEAVRPEISVISCGKNNKFNHPNAEVLTNLEAIGSKVLRTDQMGDIEVTFDDAGYYFVN